MHITEVQTKHTEQRTVVVKPTKPHVGCVGSAVVLSFRGYMHVAGADKPTLSLSGLSMLSRAEWQLTAASERHERTTMDHFIEKVITIHDLEVATREGWAVVEKLEVDDPIVFNDTVMPDAAPGCVSYPQTILRAELGRHVLFRVRRAHGDLAGKLSEEVRGLHEKLRAADQEKKDAEVALEREKKEREAASASFKHTREVYERDREKLLQAEKAKRQLEADIGKLREHMGKKAFEEALPPPKAAT